MTLAEAGEIFGYWADNPPAHLMLQTIAAMFGWKPRAAGADRAATAIAAPPPGLAVVRRGPAMPDAILDIDTLRVANRARAAAAAPQNGAKHGG